MSGDQVEIKGPDNLVEIFEQAVERFKDRDLFGTKNSEKAAYSWVTYGQVAERVDNLRAGLASLGIKKGDSIGIIANNRVEWAVAAYATYGLSAKFIPMYESELDRILKYIITDSEVKLLFVARDDIYDRVRDFPNEIESLEKIIVIEGEGDNSMAALEKIGKEQPVPSIKPEKSDIAGLIYTSGTTGNPKGVLLSHYNLASNALASTMCLPSNVGPGDRTLSFLPWAHSFGQTAELHMLIHFGGQTGFAESPLTIVDDLALVKPTLLIAVPRVFNKVYTGLKDRMDKEGGLPKKLFDMGLKESENKRSGKGGLMNSLKLGLVDKLVYSKVRDKFGGRIKMCLSSSAALSPKIAEFFSDIGIPVYEAWGMTELSPAHTVNTYEKNKPGTVGSPIPGSSLKIDTSVSFDSDKEGEIIAYGPNVMIGYHNLPDKTAEVFTEDGGLRTGDRGWIDEDGYLHITGRIKEQYKLENGKYVFPSDIEEAIKLSMFIENAMVHGANRPFNIAVIAPDWLVVDPWLQEERLPSDHNEAIKHPKLMEKIEAEVQKTCSEFAPYEVPKKLVLISETFTPENGILTPTLKLKRREVHRIHGNRIEACFDAM